MRSAESRPGGSIGSIRIAGTLSILIALAAGCAGNRRQVASVPPAVEPAPPVRSPSRPGVRHRVEAGQTLWRIARAYGVTVEDLARINSVVDPASLEIGRELFVPGATVSLDVPAYPAPLGDLAAPPGSPVEARFDWPIAGGRVLSGYGAPRSDHAHVGIDIGGEPGQAVLAAGAGRIVYSGSTLRGYGKTIIIDHGGELRSLYAHNSTLLAREGEMVERGAVIAHVGRSGNASAEHCHFEIRENDVPVDPLLYLQSAAVGTR